MTQAQIGLELGISQMHVSRLLAHALGYLRPRVLGIADRPEGRMIQAQLPPPGRTMRPVLGDVLAVLTGEEAKRELATASRRPRPVNNDQQPDAHDWGA